MLPKNRLIYPLLGLLFLTLSAFAFHKFYMGVFQVNYAAEKKMIQITSRIFVDDLNNGIEKKYHKKTYIGTEKETQADVDLLKKYLSEFDSSIADIEIIHGPNREGDIPHSLASIDKAKKLLNYNPKYSFQEGLKEAVKWYWEYLK